MSGGGRMCVWVDVDGERRAAEVDGAARVGDVRAALRDFVGDRGLCFAGRLLRDDVALEDAGVAAQATLAASPLSASAVQSVQRAVADGDDTVELAEGLTDAEVAAVEAKYGFAFPPDLRFFYQVGVPRRARARMPADSHQTLGQWLACGWHDWKHLARTDVEVGSEEDSVTAQWKWQCDPADWSAQDVDISENKLIPLCGHRMMPSLPCAAGNPVLSCYGCGDTTKYADNLWKWLQNDCKVADLPQQLAALPSTPLGDVPLWADNTV